MGRNAYTTLAMIGCLLLLAGLSTGGHREAAADTASGKGPVPAVQPLSDNGGLQVGPKDRCPLCGMYPAKRPKSAAGMMLADGRTFYFCANGCLLRAWRQPVKYLGVDRADIRRMVVQDYFSGAPLDARGAWWVAGSDVIGPMGPALVTLDGSQAVDSFRARHGATIVFQLDQMDDDLWRRLFPPK